MKAERIADGLWRVLRGYVNAYVIEADDGLVLVDCGMPRRDSRIASAIRGTGHSPADVKHILITHHHVDHIGSLAALARRTGAAVWVPAADAPIVRRERPAPGPNRTRLSGRILGPVLTRIEPKFEPAAIDHEISDGDVVPVAGGIRAIHSPGHTAGHTSFLVPRDGGILVAGDAAGATGSKVVPPVSGIFALFTEDLQEAERSFRKLAELEFETAVFGHTRPLVGHAAQRFRENLGRLA